MTMWKAVIGFAILGFVSGALITQTIEVALIMIPIGAVIGAGLEFCFGDCTCF